MPSLMSVAKLLSQRGPVPKLAPHPWLLLSLMLFILGFGDPARAIDLTSAVHVSNTGTDSSTCGGEDSSCRSITQSVANANEGDTILVGPGRYGDLNGNGVYGEIGEEPAEVGFGCYCMIKVNKRVTLLSRDGAFPTVVDAGGLRVNTVSIVASGVVLGQPRHGFLITGAGQGFNGVGGFYPDDVTVAGNVATGNGGAGICVSGRNSVVSDNLASGNASAGFCIFGNGNTVRNNVANMNGSQGFVLVGTGHVVRGNEASANVHDGFTVFGTGIQLTRNSAVGNRGFGIQFASGGSAIVRYNNIYGNNSVPSVGLTNCGLFNESGSAVIATDNFWGNPSGPGPDPSDNAGAVSGCDRGPGSSTSILPFVTEEFAIGVTSLK